MKTILQLPVDIPKEQDLTKFPDSNIINETDTTEGTPVVREIYGDLLENAYKLLRLAKISPSGQEDNELNGHQIVHALRLFSNSMNDVEQQLNLTGSVFSIGLDLSILPNKYVCFARSVESMAENTAYSFKGSGTEVYEFEAITKFLSGDLVLLVIDTGKVRAYNMKFAIGTSEVKEIFTPFGSPVAYSDESTVYYQSEGILYTDKPEAFDLQNALRVFESNGTLLVHEMLIISGYVYCLVLYPNTLVYKMYRFSLTNMSAPLPVTLIGSSLPNLGPDRRPHIYTNGLNMYISNDTGTTSFDAHLAIYSINNTSGELTYIGTINVDPSFEKTTNAVAINGAIYTFINGFLAKYSLASGQRTNIGSFPTFIGLLFRLKNDVYYSNGEVAKKWILA